MPNLSDNFRHAFRMHPTGVALITARVDDRPVGMTVSSLASLSLEPPAVSFSISREVGTGADLLRASSFLIHLLSVEQTNIADIFARPGTADQRFTEEQGWDVLPTGEPYLPAALYALRAKPQGNLKVGGARLIAAEVVNILPGRAGEPLLYQNRRFLGLGNATEVVSGSAD